MDNIKEGVEEILRGYLDFEVSGETNDGRKLYKII